VLPLIAGIAVLLVVITGDAWYFFNSGRTRAVTESMPMAAARLSIVVLPFANLSGDPSQDYFAEGITENLTTALSRLSRQLRHRALNRDDLQGQEHRRQGDRPGAWRALRA